MFLKEKSTAILMSLPAAWLVLLFGVVGAQAQVSERDLYLSESTAQSLETNSALATSPPARRLRYNLGLSAQSFTNEREESRFAGFKLGGQWQRGLLDSLNIRIAAGLNLNSSYSQSVFGDSVQKSPFTLSEAVVAWQPLRAEGLETEIAGGAIAQEPLETPFIVDSSLAFPGVSEQIAIGGKNLKVKTRAQQVIPTSATLSTRTAGSEKTPYLLTETLEVSSNAWTPLLARIYGTHFKFAPLPSLTAFDSDRWGNTVLNNDNPITARYAFGFDGWVAGAETEMRFFSFLSFTVGSQYLTNTRAPKGYRSGRLSYVQANIQLMRDIDLLPRFENFYNESDTAPAYYNDSNYGHNNRVGQAAELMVDFKRYGFKTGGRFVRADLINSVPGQSRQDYLMLKLETQYEDL